MDVKIILFIVFVTLPFLAATFSFLAQRDKYSVRITAAVLGFSRLICILFLANFLYSKNKIIEYQLPFLPDFGINLSFRIDMPALAILSIADLVFIFSYLAFPLRHRFRSVIYTLLMAGQGFAAIYLLCTDMFVLSTLQILIALILYFLIKFAVNILGTEWNADSAVGIPESILLNYCIAAVIMMIWSISSGYYSAIKAPEMVGAPNINLWLVGFVFSLPIAPWSGWFNRALDLLPEAVSVIIILFISLILFKQMTISSSLFLASIEKVKNFFIAAGAVSCFFSASALFMKQAKREMLGYIPKFYIGLTLICMGMYSQESFKAAFFICYLLPIFSALILYISAVHLNQFRAYVLVGFFLAFLLGIPGTPLFRVFGIMITRSIELGVNYTAAFGLLWFLYFVANVHICRRIFLDDKPAPNTESDIVLGGAKELIFIGAMLFFVGAIVLIS